MAAAPAERAPLVFTHRENNTERVAALCETAGGLGLKTGMGLADARAMHPSIEVVARDPDANRAMLEGLADWCDRYTPLVAMDEPDGLFLDISGCAHLFGGEKAMLDDCLTRLFHQGFAVSAGLASTPGAAWAAAHHGHEPAIEPGAEAEALAPMPLAALRIPPATREGLHAVGLRCAGAVIAAPRAPLARRFGRDLLVRIDQALGRIDEPVSPRLPVATLSAERSLTEPVTGTEQVEHLAGMLAASLKPALEERGEGARALELALFRVDGAVARIALGTARPLRDPALVRRLFHERLAALESDLDSGFGFELLRLSVLASGPFDSRQSDLGGDNGKVTDSVAGFADRVAARFGSGGIMVPVAVESHIPERAVEYRSFIPDRPANPAKDYDGGEEPGRLLPERPIRLFSNPEPVEAVAEVPEGPPVTFRWRRALHRVAKAEGPERIAPEWWRSENDAVRDYYRIEDEAGRRYWLYRSGLYGTGGETPRWFMHGFFA